MNDNRIGLICKCCNKPVNSNGISGEPVHLFLIISGNPVEQMSGEYDSKGSVIMKRRRNVRFESYKWRIGMNYVKMLHNDNNDDNGLAIVHQRCSVEHSTSFPTTISLDDQELGNGNFVPCHDRMLHGYAVLDTEFQPNNITEDVTEDVIELLSKASILLESK